MLFEKTEIRQINRKRLFEKQSFQITLRWTLCELEQSACNVGYSEKAGRKTKLDHSDYKINKVFTQCGETRSH